MVIDGSCYVMGHGGVAAAAMNDGVKVGVALCWWWGCCWIGNDGGVWQRDGGCLLCSIDIGNG